MLIALSLSCRKIYQSLNKKNFNARIYFRYNIFRCQVPITDFIYFFLPSRFSHLFYTIVGFYFENMVTSDLDLRITFNKLLYSLALTKSQSH